MTLFPAIIVFAVVFLSFSKKVLFSSEDVEKSKTSENKNPEVSINTSDLLKKYELLRTLKQ
ncbi:MAG: hypothetical protein AAF821_03885 [Cyanobacteria bacterium P01_D01_bin.156]